MGESSQQKPVPIFAHCDFPLQMGDEEVLVQQLGRIPRKPWRVAVRCRKKYPQVIASPSLLDDGTPFPTTFWLTCPWLIEEVSKLESAGEIARWNERVAEDEALREALRGSARQFEPARREESRRPDQEMSKGERPAGDSFKDDPCEHVSVAGQKDPLAVKCLHARVALALAGIADPIGNEVLDAIYGERGRAHRAWHREGDRG